MLKDQITLWKNPDDRKNTEYGFITNREWMDLECKRLGGMFFIGRNKIGLVAIFRRLIKGSTRERLVK